LPFDGNSFDAVVGHGILHHLDLRCIFREVTRVLRAKGKVAFYEPNLLNPIVFALFRWIRPSYYSPDEMALHKSQVRGVMQECGFCEIEIRPVQIMLNQTPDRLVPVMEAASRVFEKIPIVREFGGSLLIHGTLRK